MKKNNKFEDFQSEAYYLKYENLTFGNKHEQVFRHNEIFGTMTQYDDWEEVLKSFIFSFWHRYHGNHSDGHGKYKCSITKMKLTDNTFIVKN